jgi:hypothetical protein
MLPQADSRVRLKKHSLMSIVSFATAVFLICFQPGGCSSGRLVFLLAFG